ncbi:MAG: tetratricopeptide repeat protein [Myxococcaceae bacterium]|nr:tetratricopeptide repeat protein [Myxococcaceae bacterium]
MFRPGPIRAPMLAVIAAVSACGCQGPRATRERPVDALVAALHDAGLEHEHPFELDEARAALVRRTIGTFGTPEERLTRVIASLNGDTGQGFVYQRNTTRTAQQTFDSRSGDCMTYAALAVAMSRSLGVPTYFVYVKDLPVYYDDGEWLFSATHMAIGLGSGPHSLVIDFTGNGNGLSSSVYQRVDDATAAALFFNNRAAERLVAGDVRGAETLLRRVIDFAPDVRESWANLGAVLNRQGRYHDTLVLTRQSLAKFPDYQPLWSNAVRAARAGGDEALAHLLETRAAEIAEGDPWFHFVRGVNAFQAGDFARAIASLERAASGMDDGSLVRAWLVRAYVVGGQPDRGLELYAKLRREFPGDRNLDALARDVPILAGAEPVDAPKTAEADHRFMKKLRKKR